MTTAATILAVVAALAVPVIGYLTLVRRFSGKIALTEASKLWDVSEQMRTEYRAEIERLQGVVDRMERRIDEVETVNAELREKNGDLHRMIDQHERTIEDLRHQVADLRKRNELLEGERDELKQRIEEVENGT